MSRNDSSVPGRKTNKKEAGRLYSVPTRKTSKGTIKCLKTKERPRALKQEEKVSMRKRRGTGGHTGCRELTSEQRVFPQGPGGDMIPPIRLQSQTEHQKPQRLINFHSRDLTLNAQDNLLTIMTDGKKADIAKIKHRWKSG